VVVDFIVVVVGMVVVVTKLLVVVGIVVVVSLILVVNLLNSPSSSIPATEDISIASSPSFFARKNNNRTKRETKIRIRI